MNKILVILGPTATGKSNLAVKIAKKYNGEVISADSRQVYKGLDIGTGKITKVEMQGVHHWLLDIANPQKTFTVTDFKKQAEEKLEKIWKRNKLPIICGGTGFYIDSLINNTSLPEVPPNKKLRKELEKKSLLELQDILKKLDKERFKTIDIKNKVRLIRAIEIAKVLGKVPRLDKNEYSYNTLKIGLRLPNEELRDKIKKRIISRMKKGMVKEAENLHKKGLSFKRMRELGLEYRLLADLLENKINKKEFILKLEKEIWHYAKRQMTWFKRDKNIKWFNPKQTRKTDKIVKMFLTDTPKDSKVS